jgi:hypothetical protein
MKSVRILIIILLLIGFFKPVASHPLSIVLQDFFFGFYKDSLVISYSLKAEPLAIDRFYTLVDTDKSGTISEEEVNKFSDEVVLKNYVGRLNNRDITLEKIGYKTKTQSEIRSKNDSFLDITYQVKEPYLLDTNSFLFKYKKKLFPEDPNGDAIGYIDNIDVGDEAKKISGDRTNDAEGIPEYSLVYKLLDDAQSSEIPQNNPQPQFQRIRQNITLNPKADDSKGFILGVISVLFSLVLGFLHLFTYYDDKKALKRYFQNQHIRLTNIPILGLSYACAMSFIITLIAGLLFWDYSGSSFLYKYLTGFIGSALLTLLAINFFREAYEAYKRNELGGGLYDLIQPSYETEVLKEKVKPEVNIDSLPKLLITGVTNGILSRIDLLALVLFSIKLEELKIGYIWLISFILGLTISNFLLIKNTYKNRNENLREKMDIAAPLFLGFVIVILLLVLK